ncbi:Kinase interacting (KIP1-like) family protein [Zostera marina]|uniref:Kinase interacting (KIP1-like) family protein n=1 Tax=Zostera marina TaxID=29655 RepID=A0A0K9PQB2_ZOSMR|nr:Kinase interacting (KIP1-like) family protein [Zostera marina]
MTIGYQNGSCRISTSNKPSWLRATLADFEQRYRSLSSPRRQCDFPEERESSVGWSSSASTLSIDSFADRAENYYRKRPQLVTLLHDIYNRYLSLSDRYTQLLHKPTNPFSNSKTQIFVVHSDLDDAEDALIFTDAIPDLDVDRHNATSDPDSSLSFQTPKSIGKGRAREVFVQPDQLVAEVVTTEMEKAILAHEVEIIEQHHSESSRKVDLQESLLEVLESERMVLLTENARLGYQATETAEENEELLAEVDFVKKKAEELACCVTKLQEERKVFAMGRKIEDLQTQIYGLEKRNKECYEAMIEKEDEKTAMVNGLFAEIDRVKNENKRMREKIEFEEEEEEEELNTGGRRRSKRRKWLADVVKKVEGLVLCGSHVGKEKED